MARTVETTRVVRNRLRRLHRLYDAALGYVLSLNADHVVRYIVQQVGEILEFDYCYVMLVDAESHQLQLEMAWSLGKAGDGQPPGWCGVLESQVVSSRSPMLVPDTRDFPPFNGVPGGSPATMVTIPLIYRDKVIGTLTGAACQPRDFHSHEVVALTQLATPASLAIENERLYTDVRERLREKEVLLEGTAALAGKREMVDILATLATQMARVLEDAWCGLFLCDGDRLRLQAHSSWDVTASLEIAARHELGLPTDALGPGREYLPTEPENGSRGRGRKAIAGLGVSDDAPRKLDVKIRDSFSAMRTLNAMAPQDVELEGSSDPLAALAVAHGATASWLVPLVHMERARGLALIALRGREGRLKAGEVRILQALADQAAVAIENAQLLADEKRQSEEKVLLLEAARLAASSLDISEGMLGFAEMCARSLRAAHCLILRTEDEARDLRHCASWGFTDAQRKNLEDVLILRLDRENLCRDVFENRRPRIESDLERLEPGPSEQLIMSMCGAQTLGVWPMISRGPCNGLILLVFGETREFTRPQIDLMYAVVRQASIFLRNARLFEQVKERAQRLEAINDLTEAINSTRDLTSIFSIVARSTKNVVECDFTGLAIMERERNLVRIPVMSPDGSPQAFPLTESLVHDAVIEKRPIISDDIRQVDSSLEVHLSRQGIRSLIIIPLLVDREVVATLILGSRRPGAFHGQHVESLQSMADHLAMAMKNASMFEEISRINQELRQMDAIKSDFLSTVAHELRTPLTIIKGYLYVLLKDPKRFDEMALEMLETVDSQADYLKELIENLLSLSRLEANKGLVKLHVQRVRLDQLADEICSNFRLAAKKKGLTLTADVPAGLEVKADRGMLVRVFYNLVGNAMKFTSEGGITIRIRSLSTGNVECQIADTGMGIAPENLSRIFQRFFHLDGPDRKAPTGTGLGLAIVQQIVQAHGGEVRVDSEVDKGTTFTFTLAPDPPAQDQEEPPALRRSAR